MDDTMSDPSSIQVRALLARQQLLNQKHYKRLARKIHDEVSQKMTLLALQLSLASTKGDEPADWAKDCKDWADLVMQLGQSIRNITVELQPRVIDESGLASLSGGSPNSHPKTFTAKLPSATAPLPCRNSPATNSSPSAVKS